MCIRGRRKRGSGRYILRYREDRKERYLALVVVVARMMIGAGRSGASELSDGADSGSDEIGSGVWKTEKDSGRADTVFAGEDSGSDEIVRGFVLKT